MPKMTCRLIARTGSPHLQQLYTGYFMLEERGLIDLDQVVEPKTHRAGPAHLSVILDGGIRLHYDTHDSWRIDETYLGDSDYYFKRSFSRERIAELGEEGGKVRPLGLNYLVFPDRYDRFALARSRLSAGVRARVLETMRAIGLFDRVEYVPRVSLMEATPEPDVEPRVLFMVRVFDPVDDKDVPGERADEIVHLNEMRVACVRALRTEFGDRFYGGVIRTPYAEREYRDALLPDDRVSTKKNYIDLMRGYPVCVSTAGLHGSNGWKFAEYVAFSKAIVSERLVYEIPGDLAPHHNYLEFRTPDECIEQVARIVADRALRRELMENNAEYYRRYLRPDALVLNTIRAARDS